MEGKYTLAMFPIANKLYLMNTSCDSMSTDDIISNLKQIPDTDYYDAGNNLEFAWEDASFLNEWDDMPQYLFDAENAEHLATLKLRWSKFFNIEDPEDTEYYVLNRWAVIIEKPLSEVKKLINNLVISK